MSNRAKLWLLTLLGITMNLGLSCLPTWKIFGGA